MAGQSAPLQDVLFLPGSLRSFIPDDHVLVQVDAVLDLSWLEAEVRELYCEANGRPSVPPESAVRLMLAGFLLGIVHDRALLREAQVNLAIRWFAGYGLDQSLPDHSTLTRIRDRWGAERFRRILERTVQQCGAAGLVDASTLHVDATLVRADVSWSSLVEVHTEPEAPPATRSRRRKPKKRSTTDPDATLATAQQDQRLEPRFKHHTAVEDQSGVVTDVAVTTGEANEGEQLLEQIERVEATTGQTVRTVTADRAYSSARNYAALEARETDAVIALPAERRSRVRYPVERFRYDAKHRLVRCPGRKLLRPQHTDRRGTWYRAAPQDCAACPRRAQCVSPKATSRRVLIVHGYPALLRARRRRRRRDPVFQEAYRRHRWRAEGVHGQLKTPYGLRRAVRRGLANVAIQAYLAAVALNLKILARALAALRLPPVALAALERALRRCRAQCLSLWPLLLAPTRRSARATTS
jgi:transposase